MTLKPAVMERMEATSSANGGGWRKKPYRTFDTDPRVTKEVTQDSAVTIGPTGIMDRPNVESAGTRPSLRPNPTANLRKPPYLAMLESGILIFMAWNCIGAEIMA